MEVPVNRHHDPFEETRRREPEGIHVGHGNRVFTCDEAFSTSTVDGQTLAHDEDCAAREGPMSGQFECLFFWLILETQHV